MLFNTENSASAFLKKNSIIPKENQWKLVFADMKDSENILNKIRGLSQHGRKINRDKYNDLGYQNELKSSLEKLVQTKRGNAFKQILALAVLAEDPEELSRSMHALSILGERTKPKFNDYQQIYIAQKEYLDSTITPVQVSEGAKNIQKEMIDLYEVLSKEHIGSERCEKLFLDELKKKYVNNIYRNHHENEQDLRYFLEGYLFTILDRGNTEEEKAKRFNVRKILLSNPHELYLNTSRIEDQRFRVDASFWHNVDAGWIYPEKLNTNNTKSNDIKENYSYNKELEKRLNIYEKVGDPIDVLLGLSITNKEEWKKLSSIERLQKINQADAIAHSFSKLSLYEGLSSYLKQLCEQKYHKIIETTTYLRNNIDQDIDVHIPELLNGIPYKKKFSSYKECAQHPLKALDIQFTLDEALKNEGKTESIDIIDKWRREDKEGRFRLLRLARERQNMFRTMEIYDELPFTDNPQIDAVLRYLCKERADQIKKAIHYLESNIDVNEF